MEEIKIDPKDFGYENITTDKEHIQFFPYRDDVQVIALMWGEKGVAVIRDEGKV